MPKRPSLNDIVKVVVQAHESNQMEDLDGRISEDKENGKYEGKSIQILTV